MRSEKEMFDLILGIAERDEHIRAVVMNGSRANANIEPDIFQDYDIGYIVDNMAPFYDNRNFAEQFGDILILQTPETMCLDGLPPSGCGHFMYLMQFSDGTRIDLNVSTLEMLKERLEGDEKGEPMVALLDKDDCLPPMPGGSDAVYHVRPPSEKQFHDCCNEFFWITLYVAKALWRNQLPLAMYNFNVYLRDMLHQMLDWYIGTKTNFSVSPGKHGAYYRKYLYKNKYHSYLSTYPTANMRSIWNSIFSACFLFRDIALMVAEHFGFDYNIAEDRNIVVYLERIRKLPRDVTEI